jgi:hypothetical protein
MEVAAEVIDATMLGPAVVAPVDVPVGSSPVDVPVGSPPVDVPVGSLPVDVPVGSSPVDVPVGSPPVDVPVGSLPLDVPVGSLSVDVPESVVVVGAVAVADVDAVVVRSNAVAFPSNGAPTDTAPPTTTDAVSELVSLEERLLAVAAIAVMFRNGPTCLFISRGK